MLTLPPVEESLDRLVWEPAGSQVHRSSSCFVSLPPSAQCYKRGSPIQTGALISYSCRGLAAQDRRYGPFPPEPILEHPKLSYESVAGTVLSSVTL